MRSIDEHRWKESDDLVAFYLSRHGDDHLGISLTNVAARLDITPGAMRMRMSNFQSLESAGHLGNVSRQIRAVFQTYHETSEAELRGMVLEMLTQASEGR
jgi:hypothetical protein